MVYKPIPLASDYDEIVICMEEELAKSLDDFGKEELRDLMKAVYKTGCRDGIEIMTALCDLP